MRTAIQKNRLAAVSPNSDQVFSVRCTNASG